MKLTYPERFNILLAEKVLSHVARHPGQHDQCFEMALEPHSGGCQQVGCLMGWAAVFSGEKDGDSTPDHLGITYMEFSDIFDEGNNRRAIEKLTHYVVQAKAAQQSVHKLSAEDRAVLDAASEKVGV